MAVPWGSNSLTFFTHCLELFPFIGMASFITIDEQLQWNWGCYICHAAWGLFFCQINETNDKELVSLCLTIPSMQTEQTAQLLQGWTVQPRCTLDFKTYTVLNNWLWFCLCMICRVFYMAFYVLQLVLSRTKEKRMICGVLEGFSVVLWYSCCCFDIAKVSWAQNKYRLWMYLYYLNAQKSWYFIRSLSKDHCYLLYLLCVVHFRC